MKGCSVHETYRKGCSKCAEAQPARCPHCGYTPGVIPSDFDAYAQANCEHRRIHAKPAPAPLPEYLDELVGRIFSAPRIPNVPGFPPVPDCYISLHNDATELAEEVMRQFSDLTRRLAEVEECLTIAHMDGYHKGQKADEARVRELEAFKSRVMVWARGRCCTCRWDCAHPQPGKPSCNACSNGDKGDWTPAWEAGE